MCDISFIITISSHWWGCGEIGCSLMRVWWDWVFIDEGVVRLGVHWWGCGEIGCSMNMSYNILPVSPLPNNPLPVNIPCRGALQNNSYILIYTCIGYLVFAIITHLFQLSLVLLDVDVTCLFHLLVQSLGVEQLKLYNFNNYMYRTTCHSGHLCKENTCLMGTVNPSLFNMECCSWTSFNQDTCLLRTVQGRLLAVLILKDKFDCTCMQLHCTLFYNEEHYAI